ncbi:MAG: divalent-cation tolerance protein CutA [Cyanobacteriota bacterium]|nr:divalent-cation tolerance protein CutA [Cyanobacteriota bacterium]
MTTVATSDQAERLATALVEEEWVACAQILPSMQSIYRWQGSLERSSEQLILLKTTAAAYVGVEQRLRQLHPYQEPEILAIPASAVSSSYLAWVLEQTASRQGSPPSG